MKLKLSLFVAIVAMLLLSIDVQAQGRARGLRSRSNCRVVVVGQTGKRVVFRKAAPGRRKCGRRRFRSQNTKIVVINNYRRALPRCRA